MPIHSDDEITLAAERLELEQTFARYSRRTTEMAAALALGSSPGSPEGDTPVQGTIRTRDEMENGDVCFSQGPYTLEQGRALKRGKNLSTQSEADAEAFLKVRRVFTRPQLHLTRQRAH